MASTDKTPKLGLNQWAAGDRVLRTDFNEDNTKIEAGIEGTKVLVEGTKVLVEANKAAIAAAALAASNAAVKMASGHLFGDGTSNREVVLGFRPKLVFFAFANAENGVSIFNQETCFFFNRNSSAYAYSLQDNFFIITATGFRIMNVNYNMVDHQIRYMAFG